MIFLLFLGQQHQVQNTEKMEMFQDDDDDESFLSQERLRYDIFRALGVKYLVNTKENILIIY